MSDHRVFTGVSEALKARLQTYWDKKLPRLDMLLAPYPEDLREIRLTVSQHQEPPRRSWYEARGVVQLPTGTLAAEANGPEPLRVLDRVADTLSAEIRRHKERVRRDDLFKRKNRDRADLSAAGPQLQQHAEAGRRADFFRLLRPHLEILRDHARHELRILELEGTLHRGEVTVDDLLDQVLLMAWERFADRPRRLALDLWLTSLLREALERYIRQEHRPHASLGDQAQEVLGGAEPPEADSEAWWAELIGESEAVTLEDVIPGSDGTEAWHQLEAEEQRDRILSLLSSLPPTPRQAFLLHALEGYATDEIAMLQDRPEDQVKADIEMVRKQLSDRLLVEGYLDEIAQRKPTAGSGAAHQPAEDSPSSAAP